jgi:hypothetical protein
MFDSMFSGRTHGSYRIKMTVASSMIQHPQTVHVSKLGKHNVRGLNVSGVRHSHSRVIVLRSKHGPLPLELQYPPQVQGKISPQ